jgi:putative ABC transport system permease protein
LLMDNLKAALFLSYKSITRGNRWQLLLIILVMSLSFASLILTPSIMSGVTRSLDQQQINVLSGNIVVQPPANKYYLDDVQQTELKIQQAAGVVGVSPRLDSSAFIEYQWLRKNSPSDRGKSGTWQIVGIDPQKDVSVTTINKDIIRGSYLNQNDRNKIIFGVSIAGTGASADTSGNNLGGVTIGDTVRLTYANGVQKEYQVAGIFKTREMTTDLMAFVTREELISVMGPSFSDHASQILVATGKAIDENKVIAELKTAGIDGQIKSWREYGGSVGSVISSFDAIASLISAIGLVVAAIVMFIVIYINVVHRRRQIGILRALGIKTRIILYSYLFQALFYAVIGISVGGLIFRFGIQPYFELHPIDLPIGLVSLAVNPSTVQIAVAGLILAAIFAGIIPVLTIIRQSIIKAIWGN